MRVGRFVAILLCGLSAGLAAGTVDAVAYRAPLTHEVNGPQEWLKPPPASVEGNIEGACGLAISPSETLYVSDYYHRAVHSYAVFGDYGSTLSLAGGNPPPSLEPVNRLNAVCGLAFGSGTLYAEELHGRVLRLPGEAVIDPGKSTGIAVGAGGDLYVDDRTYVAVYEGPVVPGAPPVAKIGDGNLEDAYGVAVDAKSGRVYVPDAGEGTVKVFEPSVKTLEPVGVLSPPPGGFGSLLDVSLAVDESPTEGEGHVLVVDNLKPGLEFPQAAVYEFAGDGTYLDTLQARSVGPTGVKHEGPIFGEPSGIAVDQNTGDLYVTTGNSKEANVVKYGPFQAEAPPAPSLDGGSGSAAARASVVTRPSATAPAGASASVIDQRGGVRVSFNGKLTPHVLPRHGTAPVGILVEVKISATGKGDPPQLRRIAIPINRHGHFSSRGLPVCRLEQIQPSTTENALAACRHSLVGEGHFSANVKLPQQSPFPSSGKVLAFNGVFNGKPAILAHIYGTDPVPTSTVLPFLLRNGHGIYGTILEASLPQATGSWGYVTGLRMNLHRRFSYRGRSRSFLSAGCPAPAGFSGASYSLAKPRFVFAGNLTLGGGLTQSCKARG